MPRRWTTSRSSSKFVQVQYPSIELRTRGLLVDSAGVRDSALTNHGALQTERLGSHLAAREIGFTRIFSSDLQRAFKTAEAIRTAQIAATDDKSSLLTTIKVPLLREQDFGSFEGKHVSTRSSHAKGTYVDIAQAQPQRIDDFRDVETKEAMTARADEFIDKHLLPLLPAREVDEDHVVAVVSHGILLAVLWRSLLRRFSAGSVSFAPGIAPAGKAVSVEFLGGWSNTGYLELELIKGPESEMPSLESKPDDRHESTRRLNTWRLQIKAINERSHLTNLKRTGGGVGSSRLDNEQKKIDSFFKKRRVG